MKNENDVKIEVGLIDIYPHLDVDTVNGEKCSKGVMFMQIHAGKGSVVHNGKKVEFTLGSGLDGATILVANGRYAVINLERMVDAAAKAGWLEKTLDFKTLPQRRHS